MCLIESSVQEFEQREASAGSVSYWHGRIGTCAGELIVFEVYV